MNFKPGSEKHMISNSILLNQRRQFHCTQTFNLTIQVHQSTSSARIFEQLKQTHRRILRTGFINPIWNIGFASSRWPKCPGHSAMLAIHVSHFIFRSIVPSRGSLNPPGFGFPLSVVSPCSMWTTDICLCNYIKKPRNKRNKTQINFAQNKPRQFKKMNQD